MMMPRNFETNRAQAAPNKSTGPTSASGKEIVSKNALVHGLAGRRHACLPGEEGPYEQYCREMIQALAPVGVVEQTLAEHIAGDNWSLQRARGLENALFSKIAQEQADSLDQAAALAEAWVDPSKGLQKIAGYAHKIQRNIEKNTVHLKALQAERIATHAQKQEEAILLTQLAEANSETYDPAPDFPSTGAAGEFVYSAPEIKSLIARAGRLADAKILFAQAA